MPVGDKEFRVVVARYPNGGIGDHISCLAGAWYYAKQTGRTLVVDWRGSRFNPDQTLTRNCFGKLFESAPDLAGVPMLCDDAIAGLPYGLPMYPEKWTPETLLKSDHQQHTQEEVDSINALATSDYDRPEPTVVFNQWVHPAPPIAAMRVFLGSLRIAGDIRAAADQITQEQLGDRPHIAIHIRHGNGENIGHRAAYWLAPWTLFRQLRLNASTDIHCTKTHGRFADNMPDSLVPTSHFGFWQHAFLKNVAAQVKNIRTKIDLPDARPVLFCDSAEVASALKHYLPDLVTPPKSFVKTGEGPLHAVSMEDGVSKPINWRTTFEMMVELELMRRSRALICMDSNFSSISRTELDPGNVVYLRPTLVNRFVMKASSRVLRG